MTKFKRNSLIIVAISSIFWASDSVAQSYNLYNVDAKVDTVINKDDTVKVSVKSPTGAMIRSLLFPGWGQLYNKKYFKAILIFSAEIGLATNSIHLNQKYKASKTDLEREFYINNRNLSNWWLVGMILFSMADAFVDAHLSDFDESQDLSFLRIYPINANAYIGIQLSFCFQFK